MHLLPRLQQGVVGHGLPRAGGQVVAQSVQDHRQTEPRPAAGAQHRQGGQQGGAPGGEQSPLPAHQVGQHPGGQLKAQAGQVEHPRRQTDLHRGEAPQGQQQHPGGPRQMKITQPLQQQEAAYLSFQIHEQPSFPYEKNMLREKRPTKKQPRTAPQLHKFSQRDRRENRKKGALLPGRPKLFPNNSITTPKAQPMGTPSFHKSCVYHSKKRTVCQGKRPQRGDTKNSSCINWGTML